MTTELSPSYIDLDFDSIKQDIVDKMRQSSVFRDYKYDASNITILIELMAYLGSLNSYYLNKIAKNVFLDTADLRENIIRMGYLVGYYPRGACSASSIPLTYEERQSAATYTIGDRVLWTPGPSVWECKDIEIAEGISRYIIEARPGITDSVVPDITNKVVGDTIVDGQVTWQCISLGSGLTITIPEEVIDLNGVVVGDTVKINSWKMVSTDPTLASYDSEPIYFTTTSDVLYEVESFPVVVSVPIAQGRVTEYEYTGADLIDETIYLPTKSFGYDDNLNDEYPSVEVRVGEGVGNLWYRVSNFYEKITDLDNENNVYVLRLNKYDQYIIRFSNIKNVPAPTDRIYIKLIETIGSAGNVAAGTISTVYDTDMVTVITSAGDEHTLEWTDDHYTVINYDACTGGAEAENVETIKSNIEGAANSQFRCVTRSDYVYFLESHNDIKKAIVWGEQDIVGTDAGPDIKKYNKVYVAMYPRSWNDVIYSTYTTDNAGEIRKITSYTATFLDTITRYLEPYKMISANEDFENVPDLTYFKFTFGIKIKRNYRSSLVREDIKNKLAYYFNSPERTFGQTISFMDIINYIMDPTKTSEVDNYSNIKGIYHLNIRNIDFFEISSSTGTDQGTWRDPYDSTEERYPRWSTDDSDDWQENKLKEILLDFKQYPMLSVKDCIFQEEF